MKNNYIINNGYYQQYIKEDYRSFMIYFNNFSQGLFLPKSIDFLFLRKFIHTALSLLIPVVYLSKVYRCIYKHVVLEEDALIFIKGQGNFASTIRLVEKNGSLKIIKKLFSKKVFNNEKKFYELYKENPSHIRFPKHTFLSNNIIEIEYIQSKSFQRLITDGTYDFKKSIKIYMDIISQLKLLYKDTKTLLHGDLWLTNIFIQNNTYTLIDFSDSHKGNPAYDFYVLLYAILLSFNKISETTNTIKSYKINDMTIYQYLGLTMSQFIQIEKDHQRADKKKFDLIPT